MPSLNFSKQLAKGARRANIAECTIQAPYLSFAERGLLSFLLSKPLSWKPSREEIAANTTDSLKGVITLLSKLEEKRHLYRGKVADPLTGKMGFIVVAFEQQSDYDVYVERFGPPIRYSQTDIDSADDRPLGTSLSNPRGSDPEGTSSLSSPQNEQKEGQNDGSSPEGISPRLYTESIVYNTKSDSIHSKLSLLSLGDQDTSPANGLNKEETYLAERGLEKTVFSSQNQDPKNGFHLSPSTSFKQKKANLRNSAHEIPEDWEIDTSLLQWVLERRPNITDSELRDLRDNFVDHWLSSTGDGALKKNWNAAFRTWVRRDDQWGRVGKALKPTVSLPIPEKRACQFCEFAKTPGAPPCGFHSKK